MTDNTNQPAKQRTLRIYDRYFRMIADGSKTLEVRVGYGSIRRIREGDVLVFQARNATCRRRVTAVRTYPDFAQMLDQEDATKINPSQPAAQQLVDIRRIFPRDKEALGVYVFELEPVS